MAAWRRVGPERTALPLGARLGAREGGEAAADQELVPARAVLIEQQDGLARGAGPRLEARGLDLHQRDEAVDLRLVGRQLGQDAAESQRLLAELGPHPVVAGGRRVAFVEDEIDDLEHRREALGKLGPAGHLERNALLGQRPLGPHDALGNGRLRRPGTRARSPRSSGRRCRRSVSATRASVASTGWQAVKTRRSRSSPMSSSRARIEVRRRSFSIGLDLAAELLVLALDQLPAAKPVDGAMLRSGHEPGARPVRDARLRPLLERGRRARPAPVPRQGRHRAPCARVRR